MTAGTVANVNERISNVKLASYHLAGEPRVGAVVGEDVIDLTRSHAHRLAARGETEASALAAAQLPGELVRILARPEGLEAARAAGEHRAALDPQFARRAGVRVAL
jgi:hypothetical protein